MNNLHIVMNEFRNPSRILKQVGSVSALTDIDHVYVASLWGEGQTTDDKINEKVSKTFSPPDARLVKRSCWFKSLSTLNLRSEFFFPIGLKI